MKKEKYDVSQKSQNKYKLWKHLNEDLFHWFQLFIQQRDFHLRIVPHLFNPAIPFLNLLRLYCTINGINANHKLNFIPRTSKSTKVAGKQKRQIFAHYFSLSVLFAIIFWHLFNHPIFDNIQNLTSRLVWTYVKAVDKSISEIIIVEKLPLRCNSMKPYLAFFFISYYFSMQKFKRKTRPRYQWIHQVSSVSLKEL